MNPQIGVSLTQVKGGGKEEQAGDGENRGLDGYGRFSLNFKHERVTGEERERAGGIVLKRWEEGEKYGGNYATMLNISQSKRPTKRKSMKRGGSREC